MSESNRFLWLDLFSRKNETEITVLSTLRTNQLFSKLTERELVYVSKIVHVRNYMPGEVIFSQYEKGLGMYMIAKGTVEIKVSSHQSKLSPGNEVLVTSLEAGSFFGELALIDIDNKRTASAYSVGPTVLVGFFKPDLIEIMERKSETGVKILFQLARVLGKRLSETTDLITQMSREQKKEDQSNEKAAA